MMASLPVTLTPDPIAPDAAHSLFAVPDMHCAGCIAKVERK